MSNMNIPSSVSFSAHSRDVDCVSMISMDDSCGSHDLARGGDLSHGGSNHTATNSSDQTVLPQIGDRTTETTCSGLPSVPRRRGSLLGDASCQPPLDYGYQDQEDRPSVSQHYQQARRNSLQVPPRIPRRRASLTFVSEDESEDANIEKPYDQVVNEYVSSTCSGNTDCNISPPSRVRRQRRPSLVASQAA